MTSHRSARRAVLGAVLGAALWPSSALAEGARGEPGGPRDQRNVRVISFSQGSPRVGAQGTVLTEIGPRARFAVDLGYAAPLWFDALGRGAPGREWQPPVAMDALSVVSAASVHGGLRVGWRPLARQGLVLDAGYRFVAINAREGAWGLGVDGFVPPAAGGAGLDVGSTVHLATTTIAWEQPLLRRVMLRVDLGGSFVVANTVAGVTAPVVKDAGDVRRALLGTDLEERLVSAAATPVVRLSLGWRFR